ncbi:hypothetical protein V496_04101 [Pseudogymnoascus sp. VKM F-4515 (FW-2607)]|nr:hypothetical protein V496_04101 [Pseudogymnoascus sp. VKM F-4515 (FW-2607)]
MRTNVLSTLGVFTTFCQPVSSCVYGSSLQPPAEGGLEGSRFAYTNPIERLQWSQLTLNSDGSELWNVGATVGVLVNAIIGTETKGNALRRFGVDTSTEQNNFREYFSVGSNLDPDTTAVAFLTPLDMTHSTQVFDIALSPVTHIVELGKIATATAGQFSVPSAVAHPNNNPVMRYTGSPTTPSCSEGVDGMVTVAPVAISDEARNAASELVRFNTRYIQGKLGKPNLLLLAAKT